MEIGAVPLNPVNVVLTSGGGTSWLTVVLAFGAALIAGGFTVAASVITRKSIDSQAARAREHERDQAERSREHERRLAREEREQFRCEAFYPAVLGAVTEIASAAGRVHLEWSLAVENPEADGGVQAPEQRSPSVADLVKLEVQVEHRKALNENRMTQRSWRPGGATRRRTDRCRPERARPMRGHITGRTMTHPGGTD